MNLELVTRETILEAVDAIFELLTVPEREIIGYDASFSDAIETMATMRGTDLKGFYQEFLGCDDMADDEAYLFNILVSHELGNKLFKNDRPIYYRVQPVNGPALVLFRDTKGRFTLNLRLNTILKPEGTDLSELSDELSTEDIIKTLSSVVAKCGVTEVESIMLGYTELPAESMPDVTGANIRMLTAESKLPMSSDQKANKTVH